MRPKFARRLRALAIGVLLALVLGEVATRVYIKHFASERNFARFASIRDSLSAEGREAQTSRHWYLGYALTPGWKKGDNRHNALGFRGPEIPAIKAAGEFRIVCIGASTTYGAGVTDHQESYPAVLERTLHERGHEQVRVINAGCAGWTSYESLINLHLRVLDLQPDLVVIHHGINDLKARAIWPAKYFRGDNSTYRALASVVFMPPIYEYSALARVLMIQLGVIRSHTDIERDLKLYSDRLVWAKFRNQVDLGRYPAGIFRKTSFEKILATNTTRYFERNLITMIDMADRAGIQVMLSSFQHCPTHVADTPEMLEVFAGIYDGQNAAMQGVAERTSAQFFPYADLMPRSEELYADHVHLNRQGNQLKGKLHADFIESAYF